MLKITKLHISENKDKSILLTDNHTLEKIHNILIWRDDNKKSIYNFKNLQNSREIELYHSNWEKIILPDNLMLNLSIYIKTQHNINNIIWNNKYFDCVAFAHFINWIPYYNDALEADKWEFEKFTNLENLCVWDTIISWLKISPNWKIEYNWHHFSIYLWKGFFMWKMWNIWDPMVYDFETLWRVYPYEEWEIFKIKPKKVE